MRPISLLSYSAGLSDNNYTEFEDIIRRIRKLMNIYKAVNPNRDVDMLYITWKEGDIGLMSV